jgi:predicted Fe-S protein YdhL (DUF1289 family)
MSGHAAGSHERPAEPPVGAGEDVGTAAPVRSPCNGVCRIDAATGRCEGCRRTLDEIAAWSGLGEAARRSLLERLSRRA